jgi:hypothetical protein
MPALASHVLEHPGLAGLLVQCDEHARELRIAQGP